MRYLMAPLAAAVLLAAPLAAAAQDISAEQIVALSGEGCSGADVLPSLVVVKDAALTLALGEGKASSEAAKKTSRVKVRRGSEVSVATFGFSQNEGAAETPVRSFGPKIDLSFTLEGLLCQSRHNSDFVGGYWSLRGDKGDLKLDLEGRLPSDEVSLTSVTFSQTGIGLELAVSVSGELMAEDPRQLSISGTPVIRISSREAG